MVSRVDAITSSYVGLLAASNAVISKRARARLPTFSRLPYGFEPPGLGEMARLLDPSRDGAGLEQRIARVTALSVFQSLDARRTQDPYAIKPDSYGERLSTKAERARIAERSRHDDVSQRLRMCRYCAMFQELVHDFHRVPIEVLNHQAVIQSDFDPPTYIAEAGIRDFQLFVPEYLARLALERSHPLNWPETASDLFDGTSGARLEGQKPAKRWVAEQVGMHDWSQLAWERREAFLYEQAKMPWNERISARIINVLAITDFTDLCVPVERATPQGSETLSETLQRLSYGLDRQSSEAQALRHVYGPSSSSLTPLEPNQVRLLSYDYSLESCIRSSYGIEWDENGGLDVDDGGFSGSAIHYSQLTEQLVPQLTADDLAHLASGIARRYPNDARVRAFARKTLDVILPHHAPSSQPAPLGKRETLDFLKKLAVTLGEAWGPDPRGNAQEPWLLTISASKRLRYNKPKHSSVEAWAALSWMSPALLFTFINRAVCQLPHFLLEQHQKAAADSPNHRLSGAPTNRRSD